jgi:hypothetical protein
MSSTAPGTFKNRPPAPAYQKTSHAPEHRSRPWQTVPVEHWTVGECEALLRQVTVGKDGTHRWHLAISHPNRYPTWDEIKIARYEIPTLHDVAMMVQLFPPAEDWVNNHETCFHLYEAAVDIIGHPRATPLSLWALDR